MQIFNTWPDKDALALADNVKTALFNHLCEPFQNLAEAQNYWLENNPILVIIDQQEPLDELDLSLKNQITMALTTPEYAIEITQGYTIKLAILNDSGDGLYCLKIMPR